jgi:hypothetical protein
VWLLVPAVGGIPTQCRSGIVATFSRGSTRHHVSEAFHLSGDLLAYLYLPPNAGSSSVLFGGGDET